MMLLNNNKNRHKNQYRDILVKSGAILIALVLIFVIIANVKIYRRKRELNLQIANLQNKIQNLKNQNVALKEGVERASEDSYIERIAREELDMQKPGEKVFSFVRTKDEQSAEIDTQGGVAGWITKTWKSFVSVFKK